MAPSSVPIRVAQSAAATPTAIDTCEPLMALASTSRPHRSPPHGSDAARSASPLLSSAVRRAHSAYFGASGSMALRSGGAPLGRGTPSAGLASEVGCLPRNDGEA